MSRVRAFFLEEAEACLDTLRSPRGGTVHPDRLHAAARRLRGNAQLARYRQVAELAGRLEERLKTVARGDESWTDPVAAVVAADVRALEQSVQAVREGRIHQDVRTEMTTDQETPATADEVPIDEIEYSGSAALQRALDLRTALEDGIVSGDPVGPLLDELFDLIGLGIR
jgi:HPt (histidine-containing phosphotransfer) domain-containing protein